MIVTREQICNGVVNYIAGDLAPKLPGLKKFGLFTALPGIPTAVTEKIEEFRGSALYRDCFDENGNIILELACDRLTNGMQHCESIEYEGFRFREADVTTLREYIERS